MDSPLDDPKNTIPADLVGFSTVEKYRKVMESDYWSLCGRIVMELMEYELGFQGIEHLLRLTEQFRGELAKKEAKYNRWRLWSFYLELLDKTDRWEDYLAAVETLRQNPEGREFLTPPSRIVTASRGWRYKSAEDYVNAWAISQIDRREPLIQKKVDLQKAGKSVKRYMHKRPSQLTDVEYQHRLNVMKFWFFEYPKKWEGIAKDLTSLRQNKGPGPGDIWVVYSGKIDKALYEALYKKHIKGDKVEKGEK